MDSVQSHEPLDSKSHAAGPKAAIHRVPPRGAGPFSLRGGLLRRSLCARVAALCSALCSSLAQGLPALGLALCGAAAAAATPARCPGPERTWVELGTDAWLVRGEAGEADEHNRGRVTNQVLARDGARLWLIGAGTTPAAARALACQVRQRLGRGISDVLVPYARGEQTLGLSGFAGARQWAHERVPELMRRQCAACVEMMRERLGAAAVDLGPNPIRIPAHVLRGTEGSAGPWQWWALPRADDQVALVLRHRRQPLWLAPGWLWDEATPPDARSADVDKLGSATRRAAELAAADGTGARWVGEQGGVQDAGALPRVAAYWAALQQAAAGPVARGELLGAAAPLPSLPPAWNTHPQHALNWQRAWRQAEDGQFDAAPGR